MKRTYKIIELPKTGTLPSIKFSKGKYVTREGHNQMGSDGLAMENLEEYAKEIKSSCILFECPDTSDNGKFRFVNIYMIS